MLRLSVIIPTYNRAVFLSEAIQSVLDQDYFQTGAVHIDWELLVIDDGSTDHTREIVKSFKNRIQYHFQENKGVSAARNLGLRLSQGEFVAFLDSDDLWRQNKISLQMRYLTAHPEAMMCCTEEIWIRNGVRVNPKQKHRKYSGWVFEKFLPLCLLSLSSALFRRRLFDEIGVFDEELPACEDYDLGIRLSHKYPVHFLPEPLIVKRGGHQDQLSQKYWGMDRFRIAALEKALGMELSNSQEKLVKQEMAKKCRILINGFKKRNKKEEAAVFRQLMVKYNLP